MKKPVNFSIPLKTNLLLLLLLASFRLYSQDFYDHDNSFRFGEYLYHSNQFDLAAREFERCAFLKPDEKTSFLYLFKIYRKINLFDKAVSSYQRYSGKSSFANMDADFEPEYFKLLVQNNKYTDASLFLDVNPKFGSNPDLRLSAILLMKDWKDAGPYVDANNQKLNPLLTDITRQALSIRKKSPVLAGILSGVIPGSGKVYAGKWKDGVISFLMTSTAAFMAVRGFNKNPGNFYPWAMGTLSFVYYTGNIYGSVQTATKYNKDKENEVVDKTRDFILRDN